MSHLLLREQKPRPKVRFTPGRLLSSCAFAAVAAMALYPQPARSQAFDATGFQVTSGSATRNITGDGTERIDVNSNSIINWTYTPTGASNKEFLPAGNTATFEHQFSNFLVINRILASDPSQTPRIDLLGTIISEINIGDNILVPGGRLWFYAPGGILVGQDAVIDVGSLLLTANDPVEGIEFGYGTGIYTLTAPSGSTATVTNQGRLTSRSGYVALIAPRVVQQGTVNASGSVAYVAAEQVVTDIDISGSLFDISITIGSDADAPGGTTLEHSGTTRILPADGVERRVILAAVPKNDAITMLVSGDIGYASAADVEFEDGRIILSAGHNIVNGAISDAVDTAATADIDLDGGTYFVNGVDGRATGSAIATATPGEASPIVITGSLTLAAADTAVLIAEANATIDIGGDLFLFAGDLATQVGGQATLQALDGASIRIGGSASVSTQAGSFLLKEVPSATGLDATGGVSTVLAQGGSIDITGDLDVLAGGYAEEGSVSGGDGTGGTALVEAQAGTISVGGDAFVDGTGNGGAAGAASGVGTGGSASVRATDGGDITITGFADIYAYGAFSFGSFSSGLSDAFGGEALVEVLNGGSVSLGGTFIDASGYAGDGAEGLGGLAAIRGQGNVTVNGSTGVFAEAYGGFFGESGLIGGNAQGGEAVVEAGTGSLFEFLGSVDVSAGATGGAGDDGGNGTGGTARFASLGGDIDVSGALFVNASGFGGVDFGEGGAFAPGTGTGGSAWLQITNGGSAEVLGGTIVVADGNVGTIFENGGVIGPIPPGCPCVAPPPLFEFSSPAGDGFGGTVTVSVDGTLVAPDLYASAKGTGGPGLEGFSEPGGAGFDGVGGSATVEFLSGGSQVDFVTVDVRGGGGAGGAGAPGGQGGSGTGGTATLRVAGGAPLLGELAVLAGGFAAPGGEGSDADLGPFAGGAGGNGTGGTVIVEAGLGGTLALDAFDFDARGQGGLGGGGSDGVDAGAGGAGGDGTGGTLELRTTGGTIDITNVEGVFLEAPGFGGQGGPGGTSDGGTAGVGGAGGQGTGGTVLVNVVGGTINSPDTSLDSTGSGGDAGAGEVAGAAGGGSGGITRISVADGNGVSGNASLGFVNLAANGFNSDSTLGTAGLTIVEDIGTVLGGLQMDDLFASSSGAASVNGPAFQFTSTEGTVDVAGGVSIFMDGDVAFSATGTGGLNATGDVSIFTDGSVLLDHVSPAAGAATLSGGTVFIDTLVSVIGSTGSLIRSTLGNVEIVSPTIDIAAAEAAVDLLLTAGGANTIMVDVATAGEDIVLNSVGDIIVGTADAGDDFIAFAGGAFTGTSVTTTGLGPDSEVDGSNIDVAATEDVRLDQGSAADAIFLISRQGSVLSAGLLQAGTLIELDAPLDVAINDSRSGTSTFATAGNDIVANSMIAGGDIFGSAGNDIIIGSMVAGVTGPFATGVFVVEALANSAAGGAPVGTFTVEAGQTIGVSSSTDDLWSAGALPRFSDGDGLIAARFATASDDSGQPVGTQIGAAFGPLTQFGLSAPFGALVGEIGGTFFLLGANGTVSAPATGTLNLRYWDSNAGDNTGNITFGVTAGTPPPVGQGFINLSAGGDAVVGSAIAGGSIDIFAATIDLANASAGIDITLNAVGGILVGMAQAGDDFRAFAGADFSGESVTTTGSGPDDDNDGAGDGSNIEIEAVGTLQLANGDSAGEIELEAIGAVTAGTLSSGASTSIESDTSITVTTAVANLAGLPSSEIQGFSAVTPGTINVGSVTAENIGLGAFGTITAGSLDADNLVGIFSDSDIGLGDVTAGGLFYVGATSTALSENIFDGGLSEAEVEAALLGAPRLPSGGDVVIGSGTAGQMLLLAGGLLSAGTLNSAGDADIETGDSVNLASVTTVGDLIVDSGGAITIDLAQSSADVELTSGGDVTVGTAEVLDDFRVVSGGSFTGGTVLATGAIDQSNIVIQAVGDLRLDNGDAGEGIQLTSTAGSVLSSGQLVAGTDVRLTGDSGVSATSIEAGDDVQLFSQGGPVVVTTDLVAGDIVEAVGTEVDLTAQGSLSVDMVEATTGNVRLAVGGVLDFSEGSTVVGTQILLESSDLVVNSGAQIGSLGRTELIEIVANAPSFFLGGTGGTGGYNLDNGEFARFAAANIAIAGSAVTIGGLTVRGAAASGPNVLETLSIASSSSIDVVGALAFDNATGANVLSLTAGGEVFVDAAGGSIALTNAGALAGTLEITADAITVASQAAANELATLTTTDARDRRLARNDGPVNEEGYLRAADIVLAASDHIWVQNSGASTLENDRRGITAGPSTITLVATGSSPVEIILNGRQEDGSGGFITGRDLIAEVIFEGEASPVFTERSTINGCLISGPACVSGGNPELPTIQDFIEEVFGGGSEENPQSSFTRPPLTRLSSLIALEGFPFAPVIDEPVTGTGNEDFGLAPETAGTEQGADITEQVTGTGRERRPECEDEDPTNDQGCEEEEPEQ